ncbi:orf78-like protein [Peridroma alphabaculovirus]|uniref:Orf78-like protein n=1 Tax=Peridroma alphabaculovirus TaxID=1346829 RepID=A0A068LKJ1_9ABAC|nr:orf78-like protein [Peridroma alphabaculovirus]AIE47807.1 orf78-like protein [Peridroma alphabaculovirus]
MIIIPKTMAGQQFRRKYNYHNIGNALVVFSVPQRVFERRFGNTGFNMFVACADDDNTVEQTATVAGTTPRYRLCERRTFNFRQFAPIRSRQDSDNHLRIVPYTTDADADTLKFLHFAANFLDCFAEINNDFKYSAARTFNSFRIIKIYQKVSVIK